jgi:hypothetical protein
MRLTWQNVAAPEFTGVNAAYRTMSDLLGRATDSGIAMVDTFTKARADAADRMIMERMLGVQDPSQFNAQAIIGGQGARASMGMLRDVGAYQDTLINRDITQDTHRQNERGWDYLNTGRDQIAANQPAINQALLDAASGAKNPFAHLPTNLRPDILADVITDGNVALNNRLNQNTDRQNYDWTEYENDRTRRDNTFEDSAPADRETLRQMGFGLSPQNDEALINSLGWDARRVQRALNAATGGAPATNTAPTGTGLALPGSQWAATIGLTNNESGGNYGASNNAVGSGGKVGHFGALQFGQERLDDAKKAGIIPQDMTPQQFMAAGAAVQDKVADWHFADIDAQASKAGLDKYFDQVINGVTINRDSIRSMAHLGGVQGVKRFIETNGRYNPADDNGTRLSDYGQRYGGGTRTALERAIDPAIPSREIAETNEQLSDSAIGTLIPKYERLLGETPTVGAASKLLAEELGGDAGTISNHLRQIMADGRNGKRKINLAEAAAILEGSLMGGDNGDWGLADWITGRSLGGGGFGANTFAIDERERDKLVADMASGTTRDQIQVNERLARAQNTVSTIDAKIATLLTQYQAAVAAKEAGRTGMDPLIARLKAQIEQAGDQSREATELLGYLQARFRPAETPVVAAPVGPTPGIPWDLIPRASWQAGPR